MNMMENFKNGLIKDNPVFGLYLGLCSTLAVTSTLNNSIGMGVAVMAVLTLSNVIISAIRKLVPDDIRIPVYIVIIATLVKIIQMLIEAYAPALNTSLGVFIPLIVVNCIILGRAESFASKNGIVASLVDGLGMSCGYILAVVAMGIIREFLATGGISFSNPFDETQILFAFRLIPEAYTISLFSSPLGAFMTFAILAAALSGYKNNIAKKEAAAAEAKKKAAIEAAKKKKAAAAAAKAKESAA